MSGESGSNGHAPTLTPYVVAQLLFDKSIMPLPVPYGEKNPNRSQWQMERYTVDDLERFKDRTNIGVRLGMLSANLVDVDLDTIESTRVAPFFLPPTGMAWGRPSKPRSHYLYRLTSLDGAKENKFSDPTPVKDLRFRKLKATLCELRMSGQTVAPGSINTQDGHDELVRWEPGGDGEPARVDYTGLLAAMEKIAAAALVARYWTDGERHNASLPLAGLLCQGGMTEAEALTFMEAVCVGAGEAKDDIPNRLESIRSTYAKAATGDVFTAGKTLEDDYFGKTIVQRLRKWLHLSSTRREGDLGPDFLPLAGDGDGDRFLAKWQGKVLYCALQDLWYYYDGRRWQPDATERVREYAKDVVAEFRALVGQAAMKPGTFGNGNIASYKTCAEWAIRMGEDARIAAMLRSARSRPSIAVTPDQFDTNPRLLNVTNGTIELDTLNATYHIREHKSEDLITMVWPAEYQPDADSPYFRQYLDMFFPEPDRRAFIQEACGYSLTGLPKRKAVQLIGPTHSGKSMTLKLLTRHAGDYAGSLKYNSLMQDRFGAGDKARPDLVRMAKKRIVTVAEVPPNVKFDVALFKSLFSGGDAMLLRTLYDRSGGNDIAFGFTMWMSGNQAYGLDASDEAAYERIAVVKCEHQIAENDRDDAAESATLDPELTGSAFLAWALEGFKRLYRDKRGNLLTPDVVREATKELRDQLDPWTTVIAQLFEFTGDPNDGILRTEAWTWARHIYTEEFNQRIRSVPVAQAQFEESIQRRGAKAQRSSGKFNNRAMWSGVKWAEGVSNVTQPDW